MKTFMKLITLMIMAIFVASVAGCQPAASTPTEAPAEPTEVMEEPTEAMEEPTKVPEPTEAPSVEPTEEPAMEPVTIRYASGREIRP